MKTHTIVLLLGGILLVSIPSVADQHEAGEAAAASNANTENNSAAEDNGDAEDSNEESITDDAALITDEFSYAYLLDHSYGILAGVGKSSPRHLVHLEGIAFLRGRFGISMLLGYNKDQPLNTDDYDHSAKNLSLAAKARYYLPLLPISANASLGYVFWDGRIAPNEDTASDYKSYETYFGLSLSAYYFWKAGIYLESVLYGLSFSTAFGLKTDAASKYRKVITKEIEAAEHYGVFGGGLLNIAIGYIL